MRSFTYGQWEQKLKQARWDPTAQKWVNKYAEGVVGVVRPWKTWGGRVLAWVGHMLLFGEARRSLYCDKPEAAACQELLDEEAREVEAWVRRLAGEEAPA